MSRVSFVMMTLLQLLHFKEPLPGIIDNIMSQNLKYFQILFYHFLILLARNLSLSSKIVVVYKNERKFKIIGT